MSRRAVAWRLAAALGVPILASIKGQVAEDMSKSPSRRAAGARAQASRPRDVFIQFISGAKARNPAAAQALTALLDQPQTSG